MLRHRGIFSACLMEFPGVFLGFPEKSWGKALVLWQKLVYTNFYSLHKK